MLPNRGFTVLWVLVLVVVCHANPINRQAGGQNTLRLDVRNQSYSEQNAVCVNDDVLYQPGDLMPAPNPCSRCVCSPPSSQCIPIACEKKPGCKALLRPNQCCPEYQCECERNGRVYQNGERLDNAENPCEACYCQGGEVVCTTVECYKRDDCEPQYVKGKCCPKYDHCPPLAMDDARFSEPSAMEKARPHHTRSTFQPNGAPTASDAFDQALDASNVQERVHVPDTTAIPVKEHAQEPVHDEQRTQPATDAPTATQPHEDARAVPTIKIEVPAVPWTESAHETTLAPEKDEPSPVEQQEGSGDESEVQTTVSNDEQGSGAAETDVPDVKSQDEGLIGIIERVTENIKNDAATESDSTDEISTESTTDRIKETPNVKTSDHLVKKAESGEKTTITQEVTEATESESDPTTLSSEYTDMPDEMVTTEEPVSDFKHVTEKGDVDLATEALLDATTTVKDIPHSFESSTDSSPEFKDFDEWTGVKSSEFQRDSSSTGSSSNPSSSSSSSSSSDNHSKHSSSSDEESTSHFLATSINSERIKLTSDSDSNSALSASNQHSGISSIADSTELDSTEGSATTEVSDSDNTDSTPKILESTQSLYQSHESNGDIKENISLQKIKGFDEAIVRIKAEENSQQDTGNGQLNIVLDSEATDDNGPPILLIGDELANHQMGIVLATVATKPPVPVTDVPLETNQESRTSEKGEDDNQKPTSVVSVDGTTIEHVVGTTPIPENSNAEELSLIVKDAAVESQTEDPTIPLSTLADVADATHTETGTITSHEFKDVTSSTGKLGLEDAEGMMMSDDPLPGQVSEEAAVHDGNEEKVLGKTTEEIKKQKYSEMSDIKADTQDTSVLTTLSLSDTTETPSVEMKIVELETESPEREATTNTVAREEFGNTQEPQYDTTTLLNRNADSETQPKEATTTNDQIYADRRADVVDEATTESSTDKPTTINDSGVESTTIIENVKSNDNVLSVFYDKSNALNRNEAENIGVRSQLTENQEKEDQSPEDPPKDVTASAISTDNDTPTTLSPTTIFADKVKDFAHEEMLLGDQPQTIDSYPQFEPENQLKNEQQKEQYKQEQQKDEVVEDKTEMNLESAIIHEEIHNDEADQSYASIQRNEEDQNTDYPKSEAEQSQENEEQIAKIEEKVETDMNAEIVHDVQSVTEDTSSKNNGIIQETEQVEKEEHIPILVQSPQTLAEEKVAFKSNEKQSTSLPDTTDGNVKEELTTIIPITASKTVNDGELNIPTTEQTPEATEVATETERPQETTHSIPKINPEILELKPASSTPLLNTTEPQQETDITTLPPQWLKNENETKTGESPKDTKQEDSGATTDAAEALIGSTVLPTERAEENTDTAPPATTIQTPTLGGAGEHRLDDNEDADKKDLFILEDFFTKLYRHQIATDATKH